MPKLALSRDEAAEELGISRSSLDRLIRAGEIRTHSKIPSIPYTELEKFINGDTAKGRKMDEPSEAPGDGQADLWLRQDAGGRRRRPRRQASGAHALDRASVEPA